MNETKHTPPPWRVTGLGPHGAVNVDTDNRPVALTATQLDRAEDEANAKLIARAVNSHQDLVDTLWQILYSDVDNHIPDPLHKRARAVLAEAEGEQQ